MGVVNTDFVNCFLFGFYRRNTAEKQWYRPYRLPRIAYPFELKGSVSHTYANKNVVQP